MAVVAEVVLGVPDCARAEVFYRRVLGRAVPTEVETVWPGARLTFGVVDLDAAVAAIRSAGCPADDTGDTPRCRDPLGLPFTLVPEGAAAQGVLTVALYVPAAEAVRGFYDAVLSAPLEETVRLVVGRGRPGVIPTYAADDLAAAIHTVKAAGGSAIGSDPVLCTDDQGLSFYLRPAQDGSRAGAVTGRRGR